MFLKKEMLRNKNWPVLALALTLTGVVACSDDESGPTDTGQDPPAAPASVTATVQSDNTVAVTWSASTGAASYNVERNVVGSGAGFTGLATGLTETSTVDSGVSPGNTYQYRVIAVNSAGSSAPSGSVGEVTLAGEGPSTAVLSGTISGSRTLSADTTYLLQGIVLVDEGGSLSIPAGTLLQGDISIQPTALFVRQGGQIFSEGTASDPVVFTSSAPAGERRAGDWGGIVINGRSLCNFPEGECIGEGSSGPYGGENVNDNSGRLVWTRIEYAGFEVSFGNELNILTLNGVGAGTEIHHIQAHVGLDDGVEWFGGTVDAKYVLVTGATDDSFDYSTGWQGRGQFWIAQQNPDDADQGFEVDGNEDNFDATPFTAPTIYNVTLLGNGPGGTGGVESDIGMLLRRGTAGHIFNAIVHGFGDNGIDIDNSETVDRIDAGLMSIQNSIIAGNLVNFSNDDDGIDEEAVVLRAEWNNRTVDPGLVDAFNLSAPDFRPATGSAALTGFATPPSDGFFDSVNFIGGVGPTGTPWYEGWINTDQD